MDCELYRSAEGRRYYRRWLDDRWEKLQPDGSWRTLLGQTYVGNVGGRLHLLRHYRSKSWNIEVVLEHQ